MGVKGECSVIQGQGGCERGVQCNIGTRWV